MLQKPRRFVVILPLAFAIPSIPTAPLEAQVLLRPTKQTTTESQRPPTDIELEYLRRVLGDQVAGGSSTAAVPAKTASGNTQVLLASNVSRTKSSTSSKTKATAPARTASAKPATNASATTDLIQKVSIQAALDRNGYSPGVIDGSIGGKTTLAIKTFQNAKGLPITGQMDDATRTALAMDGTPPTIDYAITVQDEKEVGPSPADWNAKSKLSRLGFKSLDAVVAHRGHCSRKLLSRLNPSMRPQSLKAGDVVKIPNVNNPTLSKKAMAIEIDFDAKTVKALGNDGKPVGLFHCSIAKDKQNRPAGPCTIAGIVTNPKYLFKPDSWPEVKNVKENLIIPPGPTNPVGLCWIGLSLKGYGIHGTPEPEMIGKTGSHGCFRLTNWDALRLSEMVASGSEVRFVESTPRLARAR